MYARTSLSTARPLGGLTEHITILAHDFQHASIKVSKQQHVQEKPETQK